ncbi:uncharacterized protein G2W53_025321 [Senna tora]|uniref:Uncharacterized protein n=1 Tax=Senna tora TaxID=362788 RepID=A0A834TEL7_9FABA|nr:uncharacterized protein G2W53_025321 [Senna tora]
MPPPGILCAHVLTHYVYAIPMTPT